MYSTFGKPDKEENQLTWKEYLGSLRPLFLLSWLRGWHIAIILGVSWAIISLPCSPQCPSLQLSSVTMFTLKSHIQTTQKFTMLEEQDSWPKMCLLKGYSDHLHHHSPKLNSLVDPMGRSYPFKSLQLKSYPLRQSLKINWYFQVYVLWNLDQQPSSCYVFPKTLASWAFPLKEETGIKNIWEVLHMKFQMDSENICHLISKRKK